MTEKQVVLDLSTCGLGFAIAGGIDHPENGDPAIVVSKVIPDGAACRVGLKVGDKVVACGSTAFSFVTHEFAVETIKAAIPSRAVALTIIAPTTSDEDTPDQCQLARVAVARDAYAKGDRELSKQAHELGAADESHMTESGQYVKAMVFGGMDGIITTFAVVASVTGANLPVGVVIIMGIANLVADGLSMGVGEYTSGLSELQYAHAERQRESWEFDNYPQGEVDEMVEIYKNRGFEEDEAKTILSLMAKHPDFFIDHMMVQELGLMPPDEDESPLKQGLVMFCSFAAFGLVPLLAFIALSTVNFGEGKDAGKILFGIACGMTALALFTLGAIKSKFSTESWWWSGTTVLFNGGVAAAAAYLIGFGLEKLVDTNECPAVP
eukprot:m.10982 g.10982  ORF g.10982 m.10982 type:complete len:380 (-) comp5644_c0_seq1:182-1321(-)